MSNMKKGQMVTICPFLHKSNSHFHGKAVNDGNIQQGNLLAFIQQGNL